MFDDASTFLTDAAESVKFSAVKRRIQSLVLVDGLSHQAHRGNYGPPMLIVLDATPVLDVASTLQCGGAVRAEALSRLHL